jgi:hypothetical protein
MPRGRKKAVKVEAPPPVEFTEAEKALLAKYEGLRLRPGTLRPNPAGGTKRVVDLDCISCDRVHTRATSDIWMCPRCPSCARNHRNERRRSRKKEAE